MSSKLTLPSVQVQKKGSYVGIKRYAGLLMTVGASCCFSIVSLFVKLLAQKYNVDPYSASLWRFWGISLPMVPTFIICQCLAEKSLLNSIYPFRENWKTISKLGLRALLGSSNILFRNAALQYLTLGDTMIITYSTPIIVAILAYFILGEKCAIVSSILIFSSLIGVFIVIKPPIFTGSESFDGDRLIGVSLAFGSLFCGSMSWVITRGLRTMHFTIMMLVIGGSGALESLTLAFVFNSGNIFIPRDWNSGIMIAGTSLLAFCGQLLIILAIKFEEVGPVALFRSCDIIFGFILQILVMGVIPDSLSAIGSAIVFFCIIAIAFKKWISSWPEESKTFQKLKWMLK